MCWRRMGGWEDGMMSGCLDVRGDSRLKLLGLARSWGSASF